MDRRELFAARGYELKTCELLPTTQVVDTRKGNVSNKKGAKLVSMAVLPTILGNFWRLFGLVPGEPEHLK